MRSFVTMTQEVINSNNRTYSLTHTMYSTLNFLYFPKIYHWSPTNIVLICITKHIHKLTNTIIPYWITSAFN